MAPENGTAALVSDATTISHGGGLTDRYAAALYAHAGDENALDTVVDQMTALGHLIDDEPMLRRLLGSPLVDVASAQAALRAVLEAKGFHPIIQKFVGVVVANRRISQLAPVIAAFAALVAARRGVVVAQVETAHPLTDVQENQLRARLIEAGYGNVDIVKKVDPTLLGGLVVKIGARLLDSSLKSRLQRLQYAMKGAA